MNWPDPSEKEFVLVKKREKNAPVIPTQKRWAKTEERLVSGRGTTVIKGDILAQQGTLCGATVVKRMWCSGGGEVLKQKPEAH